MNGVMDDDANEKQEENVMTMEDKKKNQIYNQKVSCLQEILWTIRPGYPLDPDLIDKLGA